MKTDTRIPVIVVSGFLGSGKTTLLKKVLSTPELSNSMLIVNEIGEIGIDHQLLERSDDETVLLDNGCMCCQLRGDLQALLIDLGMRRYRGEIPSFDRIIVETSGLAEPGPIAQTLYGDGPLARDYRLAHVVTLIDPLNAAAREAAPAVAAAQIAAADLLVLTKTDLATQAQRSAAWAWARSINDFAGAITATYGDIDIALLANATPFDNPAFGAPAKSALFGDLAALAGPESQTQAATDGDLVPQGEQGSYLAQQLVMHPVNVSSFALRFDGALKRSLFDLFLATLVRLRGEDLLRVKGIVYFDDAAQAHLIQGVCHIYDAPVAITMTPGAPTQSALIFIARNITLKQINDLWRSFEALSL
jgi:G3E family GTPase